MPVGPQLKKWHALSSANAVAAMPTLLNDLTPRWRPIWRCTCGQVTRPLIGIALVATAMDSVGQLPVQGMLGEALKQELTTFAQTVGATIEHKTCSMMGNVNFGVTCAVRGASLEAASKAASQAGWSTAALPPLAKPGTQAVYVRKGRRLTIEADNKGTLVSASMAIRPL